MTIESVRFVHRYRLWEWVDRRDDGIAFPWFWGRAVQDRARDRILLAVIPLNWIIGGWDWLLGFLRAGPPMNWVEQAYRTGFDHGWAEGQLAGQSMAIEWATDAMQAKLDGQPVPPAPWKRP